MAALRCCCPNPPTTRPGKKPPMVDTETAMFNFTAAGDQLPTVRRAVTRDGIDAYRRASGDDNRIHYDDEFAAGTRFGGVIAHGMLTLALVSEMMAEAYGADWLNSGNLRVRFRGAAYPGDTLAATGAVSKSEPDADGAAVTCNVAVHNADNGDRIITGTASLRIRR